MAAAAAAAADDDDDDADSSNVVAKGDAAACGILMAEALRFRCDKALLRDELDRTAEAGDWVADEKRAVFKGVGKGDAMGCTEADVDLAGARGSEEGDERRGGALAAEATQQL